MSWHAEWTRHCRDAWENAEEHGLHDDYDIGMKLAMLHSEVSEALDAYLDGNPPSKKIPAFSHMEEEFADVVIRIMDECETHKFNLADAIDAKMEFNKGRPWKHGNKR